ncbi:MAG: hypothetical protein HFI48_14895 [Lachnospiraceae bacterium]|nr:hypothetical protein [Lachnospiraceae bacterium]
MKKLKNKLDEMQEQKLLKIEHNGCWLAFWGLFAAICIQVCMGPDEWERFIGEWIVFMCLAVYIVASCLKNGIWDRKLSPTPLMNLLGSIGVGIACGVIQFAVSYRRYGVLAGSIAAGIVQMIIGFLLCFAGFFIATYLYRKRVKSIEEKIENEEEK